MNDIVTRVAEKSAGYQAKVDARLCLGTAQSIRDDIVDCKYAGFQGQRIAKYCEALVDQDGQVREIIIAGFGLIILDEEMHSPYENFPEQKELLIPEFPRRSCLYMIKSLLDNGMLEKQQVDQVAMILEQTITMFGTHFIGNIARYINEKCLNGNHGQERSRSRKSL